jgi:phage-related protein
VWGAISDFFKKWWPLLLVIFLPFVALVIALWNHLHTEVWNAAKTTWGYISGFLIGTWKVISGVAKGAWDLIKKYIIQPVEDTWNLIKSVWNTIKPYLSDAWNWIAGKASSLWKLIRTYIVNPVMGVYNDISKYFTDINNYIHKKLTALINDAKSIMNGFVKIGEEIVNGIINGVENQSGALFSSLKNLANGALKAAKSFLGIGSPSKLFANEVGKWISHGVADGVITHAGVANDAVRRMASGLPGALPSGGTASSLALGLSGSAAGLVGQGGGGGTVIIDVHDNHIMNDRDLDGLVSKIGSRIATRILPAGGVRIRS